MAGLPCLLVLLAGGVAACGTDRARTPAEEDGDGDTDTDADPVDCVRELPPVGDPVVEVARLPLPVSPDGRGPRHTTVQSFAVDGELGFDCGNANGLEVLDLAGGGIVRVGTAGASCQNVTTAGGLAFATNHGTSLEPTPFLRSYDASARQVQSIEDGAVYEGLDAEGSLLAVAAHERGLALLTVEGGLPESVDLVPGFTNAFAVALAGDFAYVADGAGGLKVVDVTDPAGARVAAEVPTSAPATDVDVEGRALVLAVGNSGADVFRLDDPAVPTHVATVPTRNTTTAVSLFEGLLFTSEWSEIRIHSLGTLDCAPVLVGSEAANVADAFTRTLGVHPLAGGLLVGGWEQVVRYGLDTGVGGPEVVASIDALVFGAEAGTQAVTLFNDGDRDLLIDGADVAGAGFSVDLVPERVAPGEAAFFEVSFAPSGTTPVQGSVTLRTNDPDEPDFDVGLQGNASGYGVGDTPPADTTFVDAGTGELFSLGDLRGRHVLLAYFATF